MSYELIFWDQPPQFDVAPIDVYSSLNDGDYVPGLVDLPVDAILGRVLGEFPGARREPNGPSSEWVDWSSLDGQLGFQVEWSGQHLRVDCRPLEHEVANRLIDIAAEFGCALFDPQTGERFVSRA